MRVTIADFSNFTACLADDEKYVHLGVYFERITACGKPLAKPILSQEIDITCPDCQAELKFRSKNRGKLKMQAFGVVMHKVGGTKR